MNFRRIVGIIILIIGAAGIYGSIYIQNEVLEGKQKIRSAQKSVDQSKKVLNVAPKEVQPFGDALTGSAQSKINQGKRDVVKYEQIANWLWYGGVVLIIIGAIMIIIPKKKS